jgi:general stress protein 26
MTKLSMQRSNPGSCLLIAIATIAIFATSSIALGQATQRDIDAFAKSKLVYIATVRKDGNQSKSTPVWFTTTADHVLCIETGPDTWKAKRIRRGSPAMIWIGAENGPAFIGKAEITNDPAIKHRIITDYPEKYLSARVGLFRPSEEKFDDGKIVAIKITPVRDLPEGFTNQPATPAPSFDSAATPPAPAAPR